MRFLPDEPTVIEFRTTADNGNRHLFWSGPEDAYNAEHPPLKPRRQGRRGRGGGGARTGRGRRGGRRGRGRAGELDGVGDDEQGSDSEEEEIGDVSQPDDTTVPVACVEAEHGCCHVVHYMLDPDVRIV